MQIIENAHMPAYFRFRDREYLFFMRGTKESRKWGHGIDNYTAWKLHCLDLESGREESIDTGFLPRDVECCPVPRVAGNRVKVTFTVGEMEPNKPVFFFIYEKEGPDPFSLGRTRPVNTYGRFVYNGGKPNEYHTLCCMYPHVVLLDEKKNEATTFDIGWRSARRATPICGYHAAVTGTNEGVPVTYLLNTETGWIEGEYRVAGEPVYKCCVGDGGLYHVKRDGVERSIHLDEFELDKSVTFQTGVTRKELVRENPTVPLPQLRGPKDPHPDDEFQFDVTKMKRDMLLAKPNKTSRDYYELGQLEV